MPPNTDEEKKEGTRERKIASAPTNQAQGRLAGWVNLLAITGSAQLLVQASGFLAGILIIRLFTTQEYAIYTLANTLLGAMTVIADAGIASGVMSQGGADWKDQRKLGIIVATGMSLRRKFSCCILIIGLPVVVFLLHQHEDSWLKISAITVALLPAFFANVSAPLLEIVPKLHQDIKALQKIQILSNVGRLVLLATTLFALPFSAIAIAIGGAVQIWSNSRLSKLSKKYADYTREVSAEALEKLVNHVKLMLPGAIYYSISGQIGIWLISIFGSTEAVAQVGALGRLAMLLNIITVIFGTLVVPRFARLQDDRALLLTRFFQIQLAFLALGIAIVGAVWLFPNHALWVLGEKYSTLGNEVLLMAVGSCLGLMYGAAFVLCTQRGYVVPPILNIGVSLISQIMLFYFVGCSSVQDILICAIGSAVVQLVMWVAYFLHGLPPKHMASV